MTTYSTGVFAKKIGVSTRTLVRWEKAGILIAHRTPTNRRFYTDSDLQKYQKTSQRDKYISDLCEQCGVGYSLKTIDLERCIYKDLGNGYDIEISCANKSRQNAWIYIWHWEDERYRVVEIKADVPHHLLPATLESIERRYAHE